MENNEKKYYTFIDITDGPDGVKNITIELTLTHPEVREIAEGKKIVACNAAISNRTNMLSKALGTEIKDVDGTVWCDVNFWDDVAERFQKFLGDRDKVRLIICGRIALRTWTTQIGEPAHRVQISARNWRYIPANKQDSSDPLF